MSLKAILSLALLSLPFSLSAASADRSADYEQARKFAARDPKVRAAYEAADRKLEARIVEIDPTLKGYTPGKTKAAPAAKKAPAAAPAPAPAAKAKPAVKPAPKPVAKPAAKHSGTHVVAKGETLGGISARYGVSVAALKSANGIRDEDKLAAGQKLVIPGGKKAQHAAASSSSTAKPAEKKSNGFWGQLGL